MGECVNLFFLFDKEFDLWWDVNGMKNCLIERILKILIIFKSLKTHDIVCNFKKKIQCLLCKKVYIFDFSHQTHVQIEKSALYVVNTGLSAAVTMFMSNCLYNSGNFRWKVSLVRLGFSIKFFILQLLLYYWYWYLFYFLF